MTVICDFIIFYLKSGYYDVCTTSKGKFYPYTHRSFSFSTLKLYLYTIRGLHPTYIPIQIYDYSKDR